MQKFLGLLDMLDGGGAGRAGQTFQGGPLSNLLNDLGIRPMGYMDRLEAARPMARPTMGGTPTMSSSGVPAPAPTPAMPPAGQITQTTLPPPGQMPNDELVRLILAALAGNQATGYGPR